MVVQVVRRGGGLRVWAPLGGVGGSTMLSGVRVVAGGFRVGERKCIRRAWELHAYERALAVESSNEAGLKI